VLDYQLVAEGSSEAAPIKSLESRIQALRQDGWCLTAEEIARRLQARLPSVRNLLSKLVTEGEVAKAKGSDRARKYGLATHLCAEP
jgi:DNA-binding IclR family transcriptional regulator